MKPKHRLNLDGGALRQARDPDGRPAMLAVLAEDVEHQLGSTVDDERNSSEVRMAIDEAAKPDAVVDDVEVGIAGLMKRGKQIEAADARGRPAGFHVVLDAELADEADLAVPFADLAGKEDHIAGTAPGPKSGDRRRHLRKLDAKLAQACGEPPSPHASSAASRPFDVVTKPNRSLIL
jgi:hypothetical protein